MDRYIVAFCIVNARGTDGYSIITEWSDGSQGDPHGWYSSYDSAWDECDHERAVLGETRGTLPFIGIKDWTDSEPA